MRTQTHFHRTLGRGLSAFFLLSAAACGSDGNPIAPRATEPAATPVAEVDLGTSEVLLPAGESHHIIVHLFAADGSELTGRAIAWQSSDPAVASVDATGNVTALREGAATVSAVSEGKRGEARVQVGPPVVSAVRLDVETLALVAGQTRKLSATVIGTNGAVLADRAVTWVSSAPETATVDADGVVTAHKAGTVLVTAHAEGHEGSAVVKVTGAAAPVR